jgi:hypothetical protein
VSRLVPDVGQSASHVAMRASVRMTGGGGLILILEATVELLFSP